MKRSFAILFVVFAVVAGLWYWYVSAKQKTTIKEFHHLLVTVSQLLESGDLRASTRLHAVARTDAQATISLVDRYYTWSTIRRMWMQELQLFDSISTEVAGTTFFLTESLKPLADFLASGDYDSGGRLLADLALNGAGTDSIAQVASKYVDRMRYQDFRGAQQAASLLTELMPDTIASSVEFQLLARGTQEQAAANRSAQGRIAKEVKRIAASGSVKESSRFTPILRGKAMIWDFTKSDVDLSYELLDDELRASLWDQEISVFCILDRRNREVGRYSVSNQPGYQEVLHIGVVYWPTRSSPGIVEILGDRPASMRVVRNTPEYGSALNVKNWIESLPR